MKIEKEKNVTLDNFVQCSCKNIEQKCFIYHQMYHAHMFKFTRALYKIIQRDIFFSFSIFINPTREIQATIPG